MITSMLSGAMAVNSLATTLPNVHPRQTPVQFALKIMILIVVAM